MPEQAVKQSHDIDALMITIGAQAKAASRPLSIAGTDQKNRALLAMASAIEASRMRSLPLIGKMRLRRKAQALPLPSWTG